MAWFAAAYAALLVVSISFLDAHTPMDNRILCPLHLVGVALVVLAADKLLGYRPKSRVALAVVAVVLGGMVLMKARQNYSWNGPGRTDAEGFTSRAWQQSRAMGAVGDLPDDALIYSNVPEAIYLLTGRLASVIPFEANPYTRAARDQWVTEARDMARELRARDGTLVYFHEGNRWYLPTLAELRKRVELSVASDDDHAAVLQAK